jgi:hypothetical protein
MVSGPEPMKKRLEKTGSNLVAKQNKQGDCQKDTDYFFQILFINENEQKTQVKKEPCPFVRIKIEKTV